MVNFPPTLPTGSAATPPVNKPTARRINQSNAAAKREAFSVDRRRMKDRRAQRHSKQIMDRRTGMDRRRSSIDLSI